MTGAERWATKTMAHLTLEQKLAQLITVPLDGALAVEGSTELEQAVALATEHGVGSFVLYRGRSKEVAQLLNRLQAAAELPLLIAADFEAGAGQAVGDATEFPANMAFSAIGSPDLMHRAASIYATEGRAMGIHLAYAPVVDLSLQPHNPAESVRSFGADLDLLGRLVRAHVRGFHQQGMLVTAKHFPGRGDVDPVPHRPGWAWIDKPAAEVERLEFRAFRHAIEAGVDFVMTEHLAVPSLTDGSDEPASVEARITSGWLRERLGFRGIITSDDLWYDHVVERYGAEEVVVRSFEAGHDLILKPRDPVASIAALAEAVRSGRITERRVDEALARFLAVKAGLGLHRGRLVDVDRVEERVGIPAHRALAQEVADRSLTQLRNDGVLPLAGFSGDDRPAIVNLNVQKLQDDPLPEALSAKLLEALPGRGSWTLRPGTTPAERAMIYEATLSADLVLLSLFVQRDKYGEAAPLRREDLELIERLVAQKPGRVVAMAYGNPHLLRRLPGVAAFLVGYGEQGWFGNQQIYLESFLKALLGEILPTGRLPVDVDEAHPMGSGG